jgi:predicted AlkP superfamily pyrophosphatase or phosphodiesterase
LRRLKAEGASARALIPVFPSNTFPNHYTIVTGLWPAHHGIINNSLFDPESGRFFSNTLPMAVRDSRWWGGEPIWVTAVKQGLRSVCSFWPGSEAEIGGVRPTHWKMFNYAEPFEHRLEELMNWFQVPHDEQPNVVAFYLEETNSVGHAYGPEAPQTVEAIKLLDTRVGVILERFAAQGIVPNVVIVSDHGMANVIPERCVALDDYLDVTTVQVEFGGPAAGLRPLQGTVEDLLERLKKLPAGPKVYRAEELPERFNLKGNPRIPPVWILPEEGGTISSRKLLTPWLAKTRGEHGYDPQFSEMRGTLIVHGPAFRSDGSVIEPVENIHLYNLFCAVLHLKPATNDGDDRLVRSLLKTP